MSNGPEYTAPNRQAESQRRAVGEDRNPVKMNTPFAFGNPHGGGLLFTLFTVVDTAII